MTRTLLAIAAALAIGAVSACATTSTAGGATPSAADSSKPAPTLNDSFHYPSSD
jgi:curli biogenesis system outer membrane secretion channel CsgG